MASSTTRRDVIKGSAVLGVATLAGCLGDSDDFTINLAATGTGTSTFQAAQALSRAASEHSDFLNISVQESAGWGAHAHEYDAGEINAMGIDLNSLSQAMESTGPYEDDPVDSLPMQGHVFANLEVFWLAVEGSGIETLDDIRAGGHDIHPIEPGFGTRVLTEELIRLGDMWDQNEIVNINAADVAGAIAEGRIDALTVYGTNGLDLAGWVEETDVRSEGALYLVETDDEWAQVIQDFPGAVHSELNPQERYEWQQDIDDVTDTVDAWLLSGIWAYGPDIPEEVSYEMTRLTIEHEDTLREADPATLDYSDPATSAAAVIPDLEVHPGTAEYWEEVGVWDDSWTRGEAESL